ncbi:MAG: TQO small subunit DoxD [Cardiobacteriaceae bacterium]|nr:TQO small subunit DoxD [Cardiobacteriaceae bacterium]
MYTNNPRYPALHQLALRAISLSMGFIFFAAGWRRFFNAPNKHDITSGAHIAGKLVDAAPGSPIEGTIHWVLYHPWAAEWSTYIMSTAETLVGIALILGFMSRLAALGSALINIALMLIFGWMGHECLDEWTMAALGFAISVTIMFSGSGSYSLDAAWGKDPFAKYFTPLAGKITVILSILFTISFYSYYFGFFHLAKRTSTGTFSIVTEAMPQQPEQITLYVNGGSSSSNAYIRSITFTLANGETITQQAQDIKVTRSHFEPWSHGAGKMTDGVLKLTLGSKVDIVVPDSAHSAVIDLIDAKKDPQIHW